MSITTLPEDVFSLLEKMVARGSHYHSESERLADLAALDTFREGDPQEHHRGPILVPDPSAASMASGTPGADNQKMNSKIDALTEQVAALARIMESQMAPPVAVAPGAGDVPVEGVISNPSQAPPIAVPAGAGDAAPTAPPVA